MSYRCLSVNSQSEHDFTLNLIYAQAILIEDLNEDNKNELIIGTSSGEILIYKGSLNAPLVKSSKPIGCITCMAYDSITSSKRKYLIVHDALGYVYLFCISQIRRRYASDMSSSRTAQSSDWKLDLRMVYQSKLLINPKFVMITDLYNTNSKEMVVGYTDRSVRLYTWSSSVNANLIAQNNNSNTPASQSGNSASSNASSYVIQESGRFILEQSWELTDQIYSMCLIKDFLNNKDLLVTQSGGRVVYCKLNSLQMDTSTLSAVSSSSSLVDLATNNVNYTEVSSNNRMSNTKQNPNAASTNEEVVNFFSEISLNDTQKSNMPTFLVTNVSFKKTNNYAFLLTASGDVFFFKLINSNFPIKAPIWHINLNIVVMRHFKVDINKDDNDELLLVTPDGQIFVINCSGEYMCFDLGEPLRIFQIGYFSTDISSTSMYQFTNDSSAFNEADSYQSNTAFELALDSSPISMSQNEDVFVTNNSLCIMYVSALTNKICLLQMDAILPAMKSGKLPVQLKYRCENILTKLINFNPELSPLVELATAANDKNKSKLFEEMIDLILYS